MKKFAQSPVESFGLSEGADWRATGVSVSAEGQSFTVTHRGKDFAAVLLPLFGAHNVRNALAAVAVAHAVGIPASAIAEGLRAFKGVKRRLEVFGEAAG